MAEKKPPKRLSRLEHLQPDPRNANKHTERGMGMLERSLRQYGAGRSILVDRNGVVIAGNACLEAAASIGLKQIVVVPTNGHQMVVVQRTDLDLNDKRTEARELALADNRVGQVNLSWDAPTLVGLKDDIDLGSFWTQEELVRLLGDAVKAEDRAERQKCPCCGAFTRKNGKAHSPLVTGEKQRKRR